MGIDFDEIKKWIEALRSGKYTQTKRVLQDTNNGYCCLGVACKVLIPEDKQFTHTVFNNLKGNMPAEQPNAPEWLKMMDSDFEEKTGRYLTSLNDNYDFTFEDIANVLEEVYITNTFKTFKL